jgi:aryl-alcohol dehydrogenase-like predicted oxidoreductase
MRLSSDDGDEELALETVAQAVAAGVTVFDTAHAYGPSADGLGHNETLLADALRRCGAQERARVITKGGMTRAGGGWVPDGRARTILADCDASLAALHGLSIDLYLIHAPDPRTPWQTSVRALARLLDQRLVRHVGIANVNRRQLDEALDLVEVTAVQVALSPFDDTALRGGVVTRCEERGIDVIAHSPLGGPRRAGTLGRRRALADVADALGATPAEVALAWVLAVSPTVIAIPGARRPQTARSAARAAHLRLDAHDQAVIAGALGSPRTVVTRPPASRSAGEAEVVLVMGIPGAGKSRFAQRYTARGYVRLNRDERGGSSRQLNDALDEQLSSGYGRVVLDNTYLTRATRSHVIEAAGRHRAPIRCIWLDTPLAQAQINLVERLLERVGSLPMPEELRELARREPGVLAPTSQMRASRELEPPAGDEGFVDIERVPFARTPPTARGRVGVFVAAAAMRRPGWRQALAGVDRSAPHLVFDWSPDGTTDALGECIADLAVQGRGAVEGALCPHPAGPPICWCRPPLPGLLVAFARARDVDPSSSVLVGSAPAHRTLAAALGAHHVGV